MGVWGVVEKLLGFERRELYGGLRIAEILFSLSLARETKVVCYICGGRYGEWDWGDEISDKEIQKPM